MTDGTDGTDHAGPTRRPIGLSTAAEVGHEPPPRVGTMPWIDSHQHTGSLTWADRERFDIAGCRAAVMVAAGYYWTPYRPVGPADVRFLWDDALRRGRAFDRAHEFDQHLAVGVHTWSYVDGWEALVEALPGYCDLDEVVAVGETGIESTQHTVAWPLEEQREALAAQFHVAREAGLPVIVHTPGSSKGELNGHRRARYEETGANFTDPQLDPATAKRQAVEIDLAVADEAGLPEEALLIDHATPAVAADLLETTDCYVGFSIGAPWLRGVEVTDVAAVVEEYGADRVVLDTDLAGSMDCDPFAMKRAMLALARLGLDRAAIRALVYDNPRSLFGIGD